MFTSLPCLKRNLFSHRNKLGLKRHMKKNAKMQDICNKETKTTAASLYNFGQFSFSSVILCFSLVTITRQTSHDSGILRQDYGIIRDLPIGLCGPYIAAVLIIQGNLLPRPLAQCLFPNNTIYQTIRWLKQSILHEWTFAMK